jgi:hypothetical protein
MSFEHSAEHSVVAANEIFLGCRPRTVIKDRLPHGHPAARRGSGLVIKGITQECCEFLFLADGSQERGRQLRRPY